MTPCLTMTLSDVKTVVANLDDFIELPDGIDRLRKAVITLAVSGSLVPQDPKEGVVKIKNGAADTVMEKPFPIPESWNWVQIPDVAENLGQKIPDRDFYYVDISSIDSKRGVITDPKHLAAKEAPSRARKIVRSGSVIYSSVRPYLLNTAVVKTDSFDDEVIASTAFFVLHPRAQVSSDYLHLVVRSPFFDALVNQASVGAAYPAINDKKFAIMPVPLPPFAEQKRIIEKVNELMKQLDELEARKQERDAVRTHLTQSAMLALGTGQTTMALELLPELVKTKVDVTEFDKAILTLAVSGKLEPQDPKEGTADEVFKQLELQDGKLGRKGKVQKLSQITPDEVPFEIPKSWKWMRLGEITNYGKSEKLKPNQLKQGMWILELEDMEKDGGTLLTMVRFPNRNSLSDKNVFSAGDVLYGKLRPYLNKVLVATEDGVASSELMPLRWKGSAEYLRLVLLSSYFASYVNQRTYGMKMPRLGTEDGRRALIPVPPLKEQKRIVKKVLEITSLVQKVRSAVA